MYSHFFVQMYIYMYLSLALYIPCIQRIHTFLQCEQMREEYEEDVEDWFFHHSDQALSHYLCSERVLTNGQDGKLFILILFVTLV